MKTWIIEFFVVATVTSLGILCFHSSNVEWIGWVAVMSTFGHAQISDRMAEHQAKLPKPDVHCYEWSIRYYVVKELCWFSYFIMLHSYAALMGCIIFLLYPLWRKLYRHYNG